jgi:thioredoxin 1
MWTRALIGAGVGLLGGGVLGYFGKCTGGACPLTANPLRGGVFGMFIGAALAMAISTTGCHSQKQTAPDRSTHVTTVQQFDAQVLKVDKPVLVDFYATWCPPCKKLAPIINNLAGEYEGRANFVKVDGDKSRDLMSKYGVKVYPTVLIFSGGKPVKKIIGLRGAAEYRAALDAAITSEKGKG